MRSPLTTRPDRRTALRTVAAVGSLAVLIFSLHGRALDDGLFMDDHAHFRQLRECGWSLTGLTAACRLELVGGVIELWWLPETTLRFFRPVAFALMKLTYTLSGWSLTVMHLVSLLWHLTACVLLMILLRRLGASRWLAWAVAGLFAIHPAHVATVQWIACQTELMVTTFLLGAALCFARFRGWPGFRGSGGQRRTPGVRWAVGSVLLFALALGCRENAVTFPLVIAAVEPVVWRGRSRPALRLYAVFGLVLVAYAAARAVVLGGAALPPRPYVIPPGDPDFARFVFDKAWYYLLGEYFLIPCVPIGGLPYFQAHPLVFYGLSAVTAVILFTICVRYWRRQPGLIGPAWLLGFIVPVLPVFASPHHLYLPGVGWAVTVMLILRGLGARAVGSAVRTTRSDDGPQSGPYRGRRGSAVGLAARLRRPAMWSAVVLLGGLFGVWTHYCGLAVETGQRIEDCVAEEIAAARSGLKDGDTLYIANLPLLGHYVRLAVEERTGRRDLRLIPLTWSPRLLGPATPTELTWIDERTIEVRMAGDRYFSGPQGVLVKESTGRDIPDHVDRSAEFGFRVSILERDAEGIEALRFEFNRPLTDARLHLFWGSRARWAYEVTP